MFYCIGEVAVLGLEEFEDTGRFGAFWYRKGEVIGAFLEGGEQSDITAIKKVYYACRHCYMDTTVFILLI
jgi:hypothetical protein